MGNERASMSDRRASMGRQKWMAIDRMESHYHDLCAGHLLLQQLQLQLQLLGQSQSQLQLQFAAARLARRCSLCASLQLSASGQFSISTTWS